MATNGGSAQAYNRLAVLTAEYVQAQEIYVNWVRIGQALDGQKLLLQATGNVNEQTILKIDNVRSLCRVKANRLNKWLVARQQEMDTLNAQIQNGAFNVKED